MIHRISGKPPVKRKPTADDIEAMSPEERAAFLEETGFDARIRASKQELGEARVTQPTTDPYREATADLHRRYLAARTSEEKEAIWRDILAVDKAIDPPKIKRNRADRPPEPPTPRQEVRFIPQECPNCGAFIRVAQPLGASPPPPDLSEVVRLAREVVALLTTSGREPPPLNDSGLLSTLFFYAGPNARTAVDRETSARVSRLSEATRELRALLASQPPSTPREP